MDIEFNQYIDHCYEELERKQTQFFESFNIGSYRDYHKSQDEETLVLFNNDEDKVTFNVIYIGSWSHLNNNWMWGWNNESLNIEIRTKTEKLKMLTTKTQSILFNSNGFECNEELAFELTAVAVKELDAIGIYRIPGERSDMFLAIMNKAEGIDCISKM